MINSLGGTNREAIDETNIPIKVKSRFVNYLFYNTDLEEASFCKTTVCFFLLFLLFLALSIFLFAEVGTVIVQSVKYYEEGSSACSSVTDPVTNITTNGCSASIEVDDHMVAPIHVMYQVDNFYQNIRTYIQSKNSNQLAGNKIQEAQAQSCHPFISNSEMVKSHSWNGTALDPRAVSSPCGAIAASYFNDTYTLKDASGTTIPIDETGISWSGDPGQAYKAEPQSSDFQWVHPQNEHFIVWMRTSGLPNFKKPWGKIKQDLPKGNYTLTAQVYINSQNFQMTRNFVLTTNSRVGGRNFLLPISFLFISGMSLFAGLFFCWRFRALRSINIS